MTSRFKGLPPRIRIRNADNLSGQYPINVKTTQQSATAAVSSILLSASVDPFDDRRTIVFEATATPVVYPQKLQVGSIHLNSSLQTQFNIASASVYGKIVAGSSDDLINNQTRQVQYQPYTEQHIFDDVTSALFSTGTDPITVGPGFSSQLIDKTKIQFVLPILSLQTPPSTTASLYYYDTAQRSWIIPNDGAAAQVYTNPGDLGKPVVDSIHTDMSAWNIAGNDARLFGPFGNLITSGSDYMRGLQLFQNPSPAQYAALLIRSASLATMLSYTVRSSSLTNPIFAASDNQQIRIPEIQHPFLLERITVKFPLRIGNNWFRDNTQILKMLYARPTNTGSLMYDVGGPAITFAIQRQNTDGHRELITSATIIPDGDNIQYLVSQLQLKEGARLNSAATNESNEYSQSNGDAHTIPGGFLSYGTPTYVITPQLDISGSVSTYSYTGSIEFTIPCMVSNGMVILSDLSDPASTADVWNQLGNMYSLGFNPYGRAMDSRHSGRSYFGKEFITPNVHTFTSPYAASITPSIRADNMMQTAISPYLLLPGDRLIFSLSKYRSVRDQFHTGTYFGVGDPANKTFHTAESYVSGVLSGSHDVIYDSGNLEVTLYGSTVAGAVEYHFPSSELLTTNAIHEMLGPLVVHDQFDVESYDRLAGAYTTIIMSGSTDDAELGVDTPHGFAKKIGNTIPKRVVTLQASGERYYDSLIPLPSDIWGDDGLTAMELSVLDAVGSLASGSAALYALKSYHVTPPAEFLETNPAFNTHWAMGYPYEPRYAQYTRQKTLHTHVVNSGSIFFKRATYANPIFEFNGGVSPLSWGMIRDSRRDNDADGVYDTGYDLLLNWWPGATAFNPLASSIQRKAMFGIGDAIMNQPVWTGFQHTITFVVSDANYGDFYTDVEIRGWKYGLISALPKVTTMQFRRDHYGHFRDMLEQRPWTKTTLNGKALVSPIRVKFTSLDPLDTDSSNVSFECTSSLPYFDGTVRNRSTTPNLQLLQLDLPLWDANVIDPDQVLNIDGS